MKPRQHLTHTTMLHRHTLLNNLFCWWWKIGPFTQVRHDRGSLYYTHSEKPSGVLYGREKTYISLRVQFDEILFSLEAELSNFGPRESVDFCAVLEDEHTHVGHRQIQGNPFVILKHKWPFHDGEQWSSLLISYASTAANGGFQRWVWKSFFWKARFRGGKLLFVPRTRDSLCFLKW